MFILAWTGKQDINCKLWIGFLTQIILISLYLKNVYIVYYIRFCRSHLHSRRMSINTTPKLCESTQHSDYLFQDPQNRNPATDCDNNKKVRKNTISKCALYTSHSTFENNTSLGWYKLTLVYMCGEDKVHDFSWGTKGIWSLQAQGGTVNRIWTEKSDLKVVSFGHSHFDMPIFD